MSYLKVSHLVLIVVTASSCASLRGRNRIAVGVAAGAAAGAAGGVIFSPNDQSREMNALVFGLSGALAGGLTALLTESPEAAERKEPSLKERELGISGERREFWIAPPDLPSFVKDRLQPMVIEEYLETDQVSEDGELHEPHKVYRIKRPAELSPRPQTGPSKAGGESRGNRPSPFPSTPAPLSPANSSSSQKWGEPPTLDPTPATTREWGRELEAQDSSQLQIRRRAGRGWFGVGVQRVKGENA